MKYTELQISMAAQEFYKKAVEKYGQEFADAVVAQELQLFADSLNCFDEYAGYEEFQEYITH